MLDPHATYLLVNFGAVLFPLLLSFDRKVAFYKQWGFLAWGLLPTLVFFVFWDALFTEWGIWGFNSSYVFGLSVFGLPIEEWLFFVTVPFSCVFIYQCLVSYISAPRSLIRVWAVFPLLGATLLVTGLLLYSRAYSFYAFAGSGASVILVWYFRSRLSNFRPDSFLLMYAISMIPFLIVNGILTALPVVTYNDDENLALRIFTIPVEDMFYGLMLMLGNVAGMEARKSFLRTRVSERHPSGIVSH
jgi:lycopene cyclase domain-containing protein